jgi:tetratricopeptide (TPR) repeat protein
MLDHYAHTMGAAARILDPSRDPIHIDPPSPDTHIEPITSQAHATTWYDAERRTVLPLIRYAVDNGYDSHPWPLAWSFAGISSANGRWHDLIIAHDAAIGSLRRLGNRGDLTQAYGDVALAYGALGQYDEANKRLQQALALQDEVRNTSPAATIHRVACHLYTNQGRHHEAVNHGRRAVDAFRAIGDRIGQARALNTLGWGLIQIGEYQQALTTCGEALTLHQKLDDSRGAAAAWDSIGYAHHHLGDHTKASDCFHAALDLCRALGNQWNEVEVLLHLAQTQSAAGDLDTAHTTRQHALIIMREIDHPGAQQLAATLTPNTPTTKPAP